MMRRWWFGFYANIFFFPLGFRTLFHLHQIIERVARERGPGIYRCVQRAPWIYVCVHKMYASSGVREKKRIFSYPFFASAHHQSPLSRNAVKLRNANCLPLIASSLKNALFPSLPCTSSLCVCFFTFCRIYLDREKCLQFVYLRYLFCCCLLSGCFLFTASQKGWMALAVTMCVCARETDNYRHFHANSCRPENDEFLFNCFVLCAPSFGEKLRTFEGWKMKTWEMKNALAKWKTTIKTSSSNVRVKSVRHLKTSGSKWNIFTYIRNKKREEP